MKSVTLRADGLRARGPGRRRGLREMQRAARLLALFLLLLPVLGSLADAQFLGGQPSHGHLYVGEVAPDHAHPYDGHEIGRAHV